MKNQNRLTMEDFEGVYVYSNKCGQIYLAKIACNRDSNNNIFDNMLHGSDPDPLCSYSEYKVAELVEDDQEGAEAVFDDGGNLQGYVVINPDVQTDGEPIDENDVCVYQGMFRESSALHGNVLQSIPLATSNGCRTSTKNFQYVVGAELLDNRDMKLHFSKDYGASLYTDDGDLCPKTYVAMKLDGNEEGRRRSLSELCDRTSERYDYYGCQAANLPGVCTFVPGYEYFTGGFGCTEATSIFRVSYLIAQCPGSILGYRCI